MDSTVHPRSLDDRVVALRSLGFTPKQAGFVATVALHSGVCLRRQYAAFMRTESGKNASDFLDALVRKGLASRTRYGVRHGFIYHMFGSAIYRLLGEPDIRNRRPATPAVTARRLMLLDVALERRNGRWLTTETEKVEFFTQLGIPRTALPHRTYASSSHRTEPTVRHFVNKLPIYLQTAHNTEVTFVCALSEIGLQQLHEFLNDHRPLLRLLPWWTLLVVGPRHLANDTAVSSAFASGCSELTRSALAPNDLSWYRATAALIEQRQFASLSVQELRRFRHLRSQFEASESASPSLLAGEPSAATPPKLEIRWLPFSYPR